MRAEERARKIESYGKAGDVLVEALTRFPKEMWTFKPAPDQWSIHELVVHIADSEANSFVRCRRCIAQPGSGVMAYDEMQWARSLRYTEQSTADAIELFRLLRRNTYQLIRTLPESTWSHTIEHPENGTMTLDQWLDVYERHIPEHVAQMQANYDEWQQRIL